MNYKNLSKYDIIKWSIDELIIRYYYNKYDLSIKYPIYKNELLGFSTKDDLIPVYTKIKKKGKILNEVYIDTDYMFIRLSKLEIL